MTEAGFDPTLPLMDAKGESFSVHDALTDCAASWIVSIYRQIERHDLN